ncbi:MAG: hypothetical protein IKJ37_14250 [Kiritimatiellae bacterium]|nr:hypothetical protein [Kiritimatiellia bacterium]
MMPQASRFRPPENLPDAAFFAGAFFAVAFLRIGMASPFRFQVVAIISQNDHRLVGLGCGGSWLMTASLLLKLSLAMPTRPPDGTSLGALSQVGTDRSDPLPLLLFSSLISFPFVVSR